MRHSENTSKISHSVSLVTERLKSGLSISEWCRLRGVKPQSYYYHARKLKRLGLYPSDLETTKGKTVQAKEKSSFYTSGPHSLVELVPPVSLEDDGPLSGTSVLTVEYGGFRIQVGNGVDANTLRKVLEVVACVG